MSGNCIQAFYFSKGVSTAHSNSDRSNKEREIFVEVLISVNAVMEQHLKLFIKDTVAEKPLTFYPLINTQGGIGKLTDFITLSCNKQPTYSVNITVFIEMQNQCAV